MDTTGLIVRFNVLTNIQWEAHSLAHNSSEHKALEKSRSEVLSVLKEVGASKSIATILHVESMAIKQELDNQANSIEEKNSIITSQNQMVDAYSSLEVIQNHSAYKMATKTYSNKRIEAGLPLDSMREFIKSHTTRLSNRLASPLSIPEKNLLRQRKENLQIAKNLYIEMQREALGLSKGQDKSRGIER